MCSYTEKGVVYTEAIVVLPVLIALFVFTLYLPKIHYAGERLVSSTRFYAIERARGNDTGVEGFYRWEKGESWVAGEGNLKAGKSREKVSNSMKDGEGNIFLSAFLDLLDFILATKKYTVSVSTFIPPLKRHVQLSDTLVMTSDSMGTGDSKARKWAVRTPGLGYVAYRFIKAYASGESKALMKVLGMDKFSKEIGNVGGAVKSKWDMFTRTNEMGGEDPLKESGVEDKLKQIENEGGMCTKEPPKPENKMGKGT